MSTALAALRRHSAHLAAPVRAIVRRSAWLIVAAMATTLLAVPSASAQSGEVHWPPGMNACTDETPVVTASDAAAQTDVYAAVTLTGVLNTNCLIDAGHRGAPLPVASAALLDAANAHVYVVGGTAAVPDAKLYGRSVYRVAGKDRWATTRQVGQLAADIANGNTPTFAVIEGPPAAAPAAGRPAWCTGFDAYATAYGGAVAAHNDHQAAHDIAGEAEAAYEAAQAAAREAGDAWADGGDDAALAAARDALKAALETETAAIAAYEAARADDSEWRAAQARWFATDPADGAAWAAAKDAADRARAAYDARVQAANQAVNDAFRAVLDAHRAVSNAEDAADSEVSDAYDEALAAEDTARNAWLTADQAHREAHDAYDDAYSAVLDAWASLWTVAPEGMDWPAVVQVCEA
ncbi:MAG: hypothetical protein OXH86_18670 [Acidimicrobiaceae bacterium]|nr:hypothetical protein [Acidimicrobiaceae bacterium]MDE0499367.1 hypothetical protein [Acidimicrobiaceae bacterium]